MSHEQAPPSVALIAGASAGMAVDLLFFPIDTIKTRLQASQGFWRAGGLSGIYRGIGSVVVGSGPGAAAFFVTYEFLNTTLKRIVNKSDSPSIHMLSASGGEVIACLVRVPTEVVKQNSQATTSSQSTTSSLHTARKLVVEQGWKRLYQGFSTTIIREIPFTIVQFPLYERLKRMTSDYLNPDVPRNQRSHVPNAYSAMCGCAAGAIAAASTTPLDVAKTRIMLGQSSYSDSFARTLVEIYRKEGPIALWRGIIPRTLWIGLGGAVFLGVYETVKNASLVSNLFA